MKDIVKKASKYEVFYRSLKAKKFKNTGTQAVATETSMRYPDLEAVQNLSS